MWTQLVLFNQFLNDDGHSHQQIVTFNEEGVVTVKYQWFGDGDGGGFIMSVVRNENKDFDYYLN